MTKPQPQSFTLSQAIVNQVTSFASAGAKFSIHNITQKLRQSYQNGEIYIPELSDGGGNFGCCIEHQNVKDTFLELVSDDVFDEAKLCLSFQYVGGYREYNAVFDVPYMGAPIQTVVGSSAKVAPDDNKLDKSIVIEKIQNYLFRTNKEFVSLKEIQSSVVRNGWLCSDLENVIVLDMNIPVYQEDFDSLKFASMNYVNVQEANEILA